MTVPSDFCDLVKEDVDIVSCPFCKCSDELDVGDETKSIDLSDGEFDDITTYFVMCSVCGARGPVGCNELEAVAKWNDSAGHKPVPTTEYTNVVAALQELEQATSQYKFEEVDG